LRLYLFDKIFDTDDEFIMAVDGVLFEQKGIKFAKLDLEKILGRIVVLRKCLFLLKFQTAMAFIAKNRRIFPD
jgi:hypothetical protein